MVLGQHTKGESAMRRPITIRNGARNDEGKDKPGIPREAAC